ncbi:hypothetical protein RHSIM_Rhsim08G0111000 [Rhododendron simsii]|uniref:EF-hand domain-containing protein n=1 Tax=Rhododendron simsii TaxID=118357 RepID=A0A834GL23_RHOSS|nr:hypothetical protein RHSIM_Rhsim08G0111000 [Rhododendron simsii]
MEPEIIPKSFRCFPHKGLKLTLPRLKSKSSSNSSSPRSPGSPIRPENTRREDELREVFRHFDKDNDGKITAIEIRAYFGSIGEYMSHEEANLSSIKNLQFIQSLVVGMGEARMAWIPSDFTHEWFRLCLTAIGS